MEMGHFLSQLAVDRQVSASTQNHGWRALPLLYQYIIGTSPGGVDEFARAKRPRGTVRLALYSNRPARPGIALRFNRTPPEAGEISSILRGPGMELEGRGVQFSIVCPVLTFPSGMRPSLTF